LALVLSMVVLNQATPDQGPQTIKTDTFRTEKIKIR
jgi:hypothetical protein